MKQYLFILVILLLLLDCKKPETKKIEPQILGKRYARNYVNVYSVPNLTKKEKPIANVYTMEEVDGLELKEDGGKIFLRFKTSTQKEGYAEAKNFCEVIYTIVADGITSFKKPTLTSPIKGKLDIGSICFVRELQGDWANVDCLSAKLDKSLEDWFDIWIPTTENGLSKDPIVGQSAMSLRDGIKLIEKARKANNDPKLIESAKTELKKVMEQRNILADKARDLMTSLEPQIIEDPPKLDEKQIDSIKKVEKQTDVEEDLDSPKPNPSKEIKQ